MLNNFYVKKLKILLAFALASNKNSGRRQYTCQIVTVIARVKAITHYNNDPNKTQVTWEPVSEMKVVNINVPGLHSPAERAPRGHFNTAEFVLKCQANWNTFANGLRVGEMYKITGLVYFYDPVKWSIDPLAIVPAGDRPRKK